MASGSKIVLLQAPPGIGKTGIAIATARALGEKTVYLTGTKQLQDQYMEMPGLVEMRGRNNFMCSIDPSIDAGVALCTLGGRCDHAGKSGTPGCGYFDARRRAIEADEVVTNYSYFLVQPPQSFVSPKFLVCDEAHILRQHIETTLTLSLRFSHMNQLGWMEETGFRDVEDVEKWCKKRLPDIADLAKRVHNTAPAVTSGMTNTEQRYRAAVLGLEQVIGSVGAGIGNWVGTQQSWGWELRPVWVRNSLARYLVKTELALFMSATILSPDLYLDSLGLPNDSVEYIEFDSPFAVKNRPLIYWPVAKVSQREPDSFKKVVQAVDKLMERHPNEKGLIHTVSYSLAQAILRGTKYPGRMLVHDAKTREATLKEYRKSEKPMVLVSPSMGVGVDLPYDLCRWQVICKLPFPDQTDPQRKMQAKEELGKKLAMYDTATTLVQMYGRAVRAEDDYGTTYLLDSNFDWFRGAAKKLLPKYFTEAIRR